MGDNATQRQKARRIEQVRQTRQWMSQRWPEIFGGRGGVPLAVGEHQAIHDTAKAEKAAGEEAPPHWAIQHALRYWVNHERYLAALAAQSPRRHLDGSEAGPVTAEQAELAQRQLDKLKKQRREERAAKKKAAATAKRKKPRKAAQKPAQSGSKQEPKPSPQPSDSSSSRQGGKPERMRWQKLSLKKSPQAQPTHQRR